MARTKGQLISPVGILTVTAGLNVVGVTTVGIVTGATSIQAAVFYGNGRGLTGVASTDNIQTATDARFLSNINVSGITTVSNVSEKINALGNTGTAATINLSNGNFVTATLTENCTFTFTNPTAQANSFTLFLTNDATPGRTITWPISVIWPGGTVPTRTTTANKSDVYTFFTINSGTNWYGNIAQYNY